MITTFTGPMHSSKSETMIKYYNKIYNKDSILVFKPKVDTRDEGIIRSNYYHIGLELLCESNNAVNICSADIEAFSIL